jgi:regulator of RNase E activity RraB
MTDPKPNLSRAAIEANINYCHSQLDQLALQQDLIKEQLDHWLELLEKTDI